MPRAVGRAENSSRCSSALSCFPGLGIGPNRKECGAAIRMEEGRGAEEGQGRVEPLTVSFKSEEVTFEYGTSMHVNAAKSWAKSIIREPRSH